MPHPRPDGDGPILHRTTHDFETRGELTTTLFVALAAVGADLSPATPLAEVVDPDCLDGIFRPILWRTDRTEGFVAFPFDGYHITVHADGEIVIRASEGNDAGKNPHDTSEEVHNNSEDDGA